MYAVIPYYYATSDDKNDVEMPSEHDPSPPAKEPPIDASPVNEPSNIPTMKQPTLI